MMIRNRREVVLGLAGGTAFLLAACQAAPTPAPEKPAALAAPGLGKLFLMVDLVQGSKNLPQEQRAMRACVLSSRFPRNSEMVWRIRVHDPASGDVMSDVALDSVAVRMTTGNTLTASWGPHPKDPPNEHYWTADWIVPKDHATGTLRYSVEALAKDGRRGNFEPFIVAAALPSITEDTLADAPPKA